MAWFILWLKDTFFTDLNKESNPYNHISELVTQIPPGNDELIYYSIDFEGGQVDF